MTSDPQLSIACDLTTLGSAERVRRADLAATIRSNTVRLVETANGYQLHLRGDAALARQAEELVALERRCCRFLTIELRRDESAGVWVLDVGGADGAKAFIAAEMGILGAHGNLAGR